MRRPLKVSNRRFDDRQFEVISLRRTGHRLPDRFCHLFVYCAEAEAVVVVICICIYVSIVYICYGANPITPNPGHL